MTKDESREAILTQWHRLPAWRRRSSQDAAEFAHIMLTSRPDITDFDCPFDRFLVVRGWLVAEQQVAALSAPGNKRSAARASKAARLSGSKINC